MKINKKVAKKILGLPLRKDHAGNFEDETIKDYLKRLLTELINQGDGFSGKYPIGNSGWQFDLYCALYDGKIISCDPAELDDDFDYEAIAECDRLIMDVIKYL